MFLCSSHLRPLKTGLTATAGDVLQAHGKDPGTRRWADRSLGRRQVSLETFLVSHDAWMLCTCSCGGWTWGGVVGLQSLSAFSSPEVSSKIFFASFRDSHSFFLPNPGTAVGFEMFSLEGVTGITLVWPAFVQGHQKVLDLRHSEIIPSTFPSFLFPSAKFCAAIRAGKVPPVCKDGS